jgi:hypothetical protein
MNKSLREIRKKVVEKVDVIPIDGFIGKTADVIERINSFVGDLKKEHGVYDEFIFGDDERALHELSLSENSIPVLKNKIKQREKETPSYYRYGGELAVYGVREETDKEFEKRTAPRLSKEEISITAERKHKMYEQLKKEFENE